MKYQKKLNILFVSSEVSPFAKTGGLADVAGSLPQALVTMGHDVRVVMPKYRSITYPMKTVLDFPVTVRGRKETAIIRESYISNNLPEGQAGIPVYFIDNYQYFDREDLYCYFDEAERFAFFCRAVVEMLPKLDFRPDVIHCNDWQTGPIPVLVNEQDKFDSFYKATATIFTIHNLFYQGNYPKDCLEVLGLGCDYYHPDKMEFYGQISYLKAGLVYADIINTVSRTYAREIQTQEYGEKMEGLLRKRAHDLYGIVNGIHYCEFDPVTDSCIARNYDHKSIEKKKENKYALQAAMKLPVGDVPLFGLISRLVDQKGLDLLKEIFGGLMNQDLQFVLLGSGDSHYEEFFRQMAAKYPEKAAVHLGFNGPLAQQIYAGCDMFLMPSRFEPCGLGQLISLRYGTIPIVRATGGLADTVVNYDLITKKGNGFVFKDYRSGELQETIQRALYVYREKKEMWADMVREAMTCDFSWTNSAAEYEKLYTIAIKKRREEKVRSA